MRGSKKSNYEVSRKSGAHQVMKTERFSINLIDYYFPLNLATNTVQLKSLDELMDMHHAQE